MNFEQFKSESDLRSDAQLSELQLKEPMVEITQVEEALIRRKIRLESLDNCQNIIQGSLNG